MVVTQFEFRGLAEDFQSNFRDWICTEVISAGAAPVVYTQALF